MNTITKKIYFQPRTPKAGTPNPIPATDLLPELQIVCKSIEHLSQNKFCSTKDIVRVLARDSELSDNIMHYMKMQKNFLSGVDTIEQAVLLMGVKGIYNVVKTYSQDLQAEAQAKVSA